MPGTFVQEVASNGTGGTSTTVTATAIGSTTEGNLLVAAAVSSDYTANAATLADSKGNTWTKPVESHRTPNGPQLSVFWAVIAPGQAHSGGVDTFTATWATSMSGRTICVAEFDNLTLTPFDQSASATGASGSPTSAATSTTSQADEMLIGAFGASYGIGAAHPFTAGPGYTIASARTTVRIAEAMIEYQNVSSTGAYSASASLDLAADGWVAAILTFEAAAGGVAPPGRHLLSATGAGL